MIELSRDKLGLVVHQDGGDADLEVAGLVGWNFSTTMEEMLNTRSKVDLEVAGLVGLNFNTTMEEVVSLRNWEDLKVAGLVG